MADIFDAIAHPARRALLEELKKGAKPAGELGRELGIVREGVSKHLRVMTAAHLLTVETRGRQRWYAINPPALTEVDSWLSSYREFWDQRLDALETEIARGTRQHQPESHVPQYRKGA